MTTYRQLQELIKASYKKNREIGDIDGYELDKQLSTSETKVFHDPDKDKTVVVNRGTNPTLRDWSNNIAYLNGNYDKTQRMRNATMTQDKAIKKYGSVDTNIGHSQGSVIASRLKEKGKTGKVIQVNPASLGERDGDDVYTIRSKADFVSMLHKDNDKTKNLDTAKN